MKNNNIKRKSEQDFKYVIVSPRQGGGGSIVLHALCKHLSEKGKDAKILYTDQFLYRKERYIRFWVKWIIYTICDIYKSIYVFCLGKRKWRYQEKFPGYINTPIKGCKRKFLPFVSKNTIIIYPETAYGNFLRGKKVVRWFLYHNRYKDHEDEKYPPYEKTDLFFCYRTIFNDDALNPSKRQLYLWYIDLDTYHRTNYGEREGNCYIIRKGAGRKDLPSKFDGVIIDGLSEKEKVKVFNDCKFCISYDTQTAYSQIAALCGCISIVVPEDTKKREDYRSSQESGIGEAFGFSDEEISFAINTSSEIINLYKKLNKSGEKDVDGFIKICEEYFV